MAEARITEFCGETQIREEVLDFMGLGSCMPREAWRLPSPQTREFIERGWLEPCHSQWASPCFVVPKKVAGEWQLVVDYRSLNTQTQHDSYTLPLIEDMLQKQHQRRIFTVIDLKHGYHQMPLAGESRACTAMSTQLGPLQWKVMPMGATNGNAAFQRMHENLPELVPDHRVRGPQYEL